MDLIDIMNGTVASYRLPAPRANLTPLVNEAIAELEEEVGFTPVREDFDDIMDVFEYLKRLSINNNGRLILSKENLATFLMQQALDSGRDIEDRGGVAHFMLRHVPYLVFNKEVHPNLATICVRKVLDNNLLKQKMSDGRNELDLVFETVKHLRRKNFDFTGERIENAILAAYRGIVKKGFLPLYVDTYLESIGASAEQKTPAFRDSMVQYLMDTGLTPNQYGAFRSPWTDDLEQTRDNIQHNIDALKDKDASTDNAIQEIQSSLTSVKEKVDNEQTPTIESLKNELEELKKKVNEEQPGVLAQIKETINNILSRLNAMAELVVIDHTNILKMTEDEAAKLASKGITTYVALAHYHGKHGAFKKILDDLDINIDEVNKTWPKQAKFLVEGASDKLKALKEKLGNPPSAK